MLILGNRPKYNGSNSGEFHDNMVCIHVNYNAYFVNCVLRLSLGNREIRCVKGAVSGSHIRPLVTLLTASNQTTILWKSTAGAKTELRDGDAEGVP
jgi:hypothetical protein